MGSNGAAYLQVLLVLALIGYVIVKRLAGQPLTSRRLLVVPAVMVGIGLVELAGTRITGGLVALLAVETLVGLGFGVLRGTTIEVYERGGHLWYRYRPVTVLLWVLAIGARIGVAVVARRAGVELPGTSVLVAFGVSLLGEGAVVAPRARRLGVPYAPDRRTARASADLGR